MKETACLLRLSSLLPGESLPSLLVRLTKLNHYQNPSLISQLCQEKLSQPDSVTQPTRAETYEVLATLVKIKVTELYQASAHRLATTLNPPTQASETITLSSDQVVSLLTGFSQHQLVWPEVRSQFCPRCLAEAAYHRISWFPKTVTICLRHQCLLLNLCPGCDQELKLIAVIEGCCSHCSFKLAESPVTSVAEDEFGLFSQATLQFWLNLSAEPAEYQQYALPDQPAAVLHYLLYGLSTSIIKLVRHNWSYLYSSITVRPPVFPLKSGKLGSQAQDYLLYATALKGLSHWPDGFYGFLEALKGRENHRPNQSIARDFGPLLTQWLDRNWQSPAFQFLQEKFEVYLLRDPRVALPDNALLYPIYGPLRLKIPYLTTQEAAEMLNFSPKTIDYLAELGLLVRYQPDHHELTQPYTFVRGAEVRALQQRWQGGLALPEAAQLLGTSADLLQVLIYNGVILLGPERFEEIVSLKLRPETLEPWLAEVRRELVTASTRNIDLVKIVKLLTERGFRITSVYEYALAKCLVHLRPTSSWWFSKAGLFAAEAVLISGEMELVQRQAGKPQNPLKLSRLVYPLRKWTDPNWFISLLPEGGKVKVNYG